MEEEGVEGEEECGWLVGGRKGQSRGEGERAPGDWKGANQGGRGKRLHHWLLICRPAWRKGDIH